MLFLSSPFFFAGQFYAKAYSDALNQIKGGGQKPLHVWQDALIPWLGETGNKSVETESAISGGWQSTWAGCHLKTSPHDVVERIITEKLKESGKTRCNRTTGIISAILDKACKTLACPSGDTVKCFAGAGWVERLLNGA